MSWIDHQVPVQICHTSPLCWSVLNQAPNFMRRLLPVPGDGSGTGWDPWDLWGWSWIKHRAFSCWLYWIQQDPTNRFWSTKKAVTQPLCLKAKWKFLKFETALKYIDVCFDPSIPGTGNSGLTKKTDPHGWRASKSDPPLCQTSKIRHSHHFQDPMGGKQLLPWCIRRWDFHSVESAAMVQKWIFLDHFPLFDPLVSTWFSSNLLPGSTSNIFMQMLQDDHACQLTRNSSGQRWGKLIDYILNRR